ITCAGDTNELVRASAVRALEPLARSGDPSLLVSLTKSLGDPVRAVRIEAAWALHFGLDTNLPVTRELLTDLRHNADQPAGALRFGVFHLDRGDVDMAMNYFRRAVNWDTNS